MDQNQAHPSGERRGGKGGWGGGEREGARGATRPKTQNLSVYIQRLTQSCP